MPLAPGNHKVLDSSICLSLHISCLRHYSYSLTRRTSSTVSRKSILLNMQEHEAENKSEDLLSSFFSKQVRTA